MLLNRIMRNLFLNAEGIAEIPDYDGNLIIDLNLAEHMQSRIFWLGYYSQSIIQYFNSYIEQGMTVIDVGANIGEVTLAAANRVKSTGKVIAFEPVTHIHATLSKNISKNRLHWVEPVKLGLSEKSGNAVIYASSNGDINELENIGLGTLYPMEGRRVPIEEIQLASLDSYLTDNPIERLDLIKIDIEGAELPCLLGAKETIQKFKPHIILETQKETYVAAGYSPEDLVEFFSPLKYEIFRLGVNGSLHEVTTESLNDFQNIVARPKME